MSFSIKNFRNQPSTLVLIDPITKEPFVDPDTNTAVELMCVGTDSKEFADIKMELQLRTMNSKTQPNAAEISKLTYEVWASMVVGWNPTAEKFFAEELGEDSKYSKDNANKILNNIEYHWIRPQLEAHLNDRQRFFKKQ